MNSRASLFWICSLLLLCSGFAHGGLEMAHDGLAHGQQVNPKKLPPCPPADNSKKTDNARIEKWHKCFGKFTIQFDEYQKGHTYEGEFLNGKLNGYGIHKSTSGNIYSGAFKNGQYNGAGMLVSADGVKFSGTYVDGRRKGYGVEMYPDGSTNEGVWNGFDLVVDDKKSTALSQSDLAGESLFAIKPVYDAVSRFSEGLAAVRVGNSTTGKWGYIDRTGTIVITPQFDKAYEFSQGFAPVRISGAHGLKWGYIDKTGKVVISSKFESAFPFKENYALVGVGSGDSIKYGYIDKSGTYVIKPKYDRASSFSEGLAAVRFGSFSDGKWGFVDKTGNLIIRPQFAQTEDFSNGLAAVSVGSKKDEHKWGIINRQGEIVIDFKYDWIFAGFVEAFAAARDSRTGKMGFIDKKGNFAIQPLFGLAFPFEDGFAAVQIGDEQNSLWGAIDSAGNLTIDPQFNQPFLFNDGLAAVEIGPKDAARIGYIDQSGKFLIPPYFIPQNEVEATNFFEGLAAACTYIKSSTKCGFIAKSVATVTNKHDDKVDSEQYSNRLRLQIVSTKPDLNGTFIVTVQANSDTASLKINGEEQGGRADGNYSIKRVARVGQDTQLIITAVDVYGNSDTKTIIVTRQAAPAADTSIALKPETIKRAPARDAVAIIIGIQDYKRVPKAEFANNDAKEFYEYAIRALGIKQEKIKMLLDDEADEVNIVKAFENWLPIQVNKDKTDVYVFYSGHGLPAPDGKSLYFLPHGVDKELLSRTAVGQNEIVAALSAAKPKSVTMFIDACYSGQTRGGNVLVANAKPVSLKSDTNAYPPNFTVITASTNDQISSSSPELKHGIFSFYLMKGMEGEADANKDGKITVGEMQDYLSDKVSRQAMTLNRKQTTQLVGDAGQVLVGR